jgi:hypothetical protein
MGRVASSGAGVDEEAAAVGEGATGLMALCEGLKQRWLPAITVIGLVRDRRRICVVGGSLSPPTSSRTRRRVWPGRFGAQQAVTPQPSSDAGSTT